MPTHWTYEDFERASDLEQGDILRPTEELSSLFSQVHPHFKQDKYVGFLVATQSCDLVRRDGVPKASYVNLAVIRPLVQVLPKLLGELVAPVAPGVFPKKNRADAHQLLERLFNQNEQALGLFFLYQDSDCGIGEPSVCLLRVAVAFRRQHYDKLVAARTGRIKPDFRAKLGWLVGNLYSRPATPDWGDLPGGKKKVRELIAQYLEEQIPGLGPRWLDDEIVKEAQSRGIDVAGKTPAELEEFRPKSRLAKAVDEVEAEIPKVITGLPSEAIERLKNSLNEMKAQIAVAELPEATLGAINDQVGRLQDEIERLVPGLPADLVRKVGNRLKSNGKFTKLFKALDQ